MHTNGHCHCIVSELESVIHYSFIQVSLVLVSYQSWNILVTFVISLSDIYWHIYDKLYSAVFEWSIVFIVNNKDYNEDREYTILMAPIFYCKCSNCVCKATVLVTKYEKVNASEEVKSVPEDMFGITTHEIEDVLGMPSKKKKINHYIVL